MRSTSTTGGRAQCSVGRRAPPNAWEAYLCIGIFPAASAHAWTKVHVFVGRARPGWHCASAMEALDGAGERALVVATRDGVDRDVAPIDEATCERAADAWDVRAPGFAWRGFPESVLTIAAPRVEMRAATRDVGWWARIPRILSYASAFGSMTWRDALGESRGVALVERAWGCAVPFDVARLAPRRWQWDVLATDDGHAVAGLWIAGAGVRTMGRPMEGERFATGRSMRIRVHEWKEEHGRHVPSRWEGAIGKLRYQARAATPIAPMVPGGGFVGTTWEGECGSRALRGTGFTEYRAA